MKQDTWTKFLLALIALALWLHLAHSVFTPVGVSASIQEEEGRMAHIESMLDNIDQNLEIIALGSCMNARLC